MAEITAGLVKELREKTGAGMMDCKAALTEMKGDVEAAVDWLRKKGLAKAAKKAGRVAAEGLVGSLVVGNKGVVVEVNSETDFVARNEQFQGLVQLIAEAALHNGSDLDKIKRAKVGKSTIEEAIASAIATIGENMTLRRAAELSVNAGAIGTYTHSSVLDGLGKIGVLVALESKADPKELAIFGRMVAMHIAATNPLAVDSKGIDEKTIARERDVIAEKARASGKPANVIDKIVDGKLGAFYQQVVLPEQASIRDPKMTVADVIAAASKSLGATLTVSRFARLRVGEGVQ